MIYKGIYSKVINIGKIELGGKNPILPQTMTTTDTMDTDSTVHQIIRCVKAGAKIVRVTAPSKRDAKNLKHIKKALVSKGYDVPLSADIHFTPNAAEIAAQIVEKVRINPGNYSDKKKFQYIDYSNKTYNDEVDRIRTAFTPLIKICKQHGTAMRIGTNHGSLSDRIMSRYGDTPIGMVESALEFLRIARDEQFHNIVLSMKASNPKVMIESNLLLVEKMLDEFNELYPIHLGVTEAGDGEDGRIKSAIGISTLLQKGIGDTIRVSLTEEPEFEIPVCEKIINSIVSIHKEPNLEGTKSKNVYFPKNHHFEKIETIFQEKKTIVISDFSFLKEHINYNHLKSIGYAYYSDIDKWSLTDTASDFILLNVHQQLDFELPHQLKMIRQFDAKNPKQHNTILLFSNIDDYKQYADKNTYSILQLNISHKDIDLSFLKAYKNVAIMLSAHNTTLAYYEFEWMIAKIKSHNANIPIILNYTSTQKDKEQIMLESSAHVGEFFIKNMAQGILINTNSQSKLSDSFSRTYHNSKSQEEFLKDVSFSILQATRVRISKTEYISCPSCGRTLFDLQQTTNTIRNLTGHLKGVKIAIMGCIVNGPGEMADADFGYVGSGKGKITLYKGKDIVKKNIPTEHALDELVNLLKENNVWIDR